ncbi:MAG: TrmB family transcriptional regulator [Ilumatobacteraceae bacterium]
MADFQSSPDIDQAIELLKSLGMSGYEAKAYLALLGSSEPLNGYEVAKISGVPRSTIYETLGKLTAVGAAISVRRRQSRGNGAGSYVAIPADTLIARYRRDMTRRLEGLNLVLPRFASKTDSYVVQNLVGRAAIVQRMQDVMERADKYLHLSFWPEEALDILPTLWRQHDRGVETTSVYFGTPEGFPGRAFAHEHSSPEKVHDVLGCRMFSVVADHREAVIGAAEGEFIWGMWSDDPVVAMTAAEYVRHDIAIQLMATELERVGRREFFDEHEQFAFLRNASRICLESVMHHFRQAAPDQSASEIV